MRRSGRQNQNYWSWFSYHGAGKLIRITRRLNGARCDKNFDRFFWPWIQEVYPGNQIVYVIEDNSRIHTFAIVRQWYARHSNTHPKIIRLDHPSRSPDLNPIENLWAYMVKNWDEQVSHNKNQLRARVQQSWADVKRNRPLLRKLVMSMPRRLQAVIDNNGSYIRY